MWFNIGLCLSGWCRKCIFVWTILSQTPRRTPQVTYDDGRISAQIFLLFLKERRMLRKRDYQGRLSFHFFDRWMTYLATHRQKKVQAMSLKKLQMLAFCLFTWSWMGPINCAPNPDIFWHRYATVQAVKAPATVAKTARGVQVKTSPSQNAP